VAAAHRHRLEQAAARHADLLRAHQRPENTLHRQRGMNEWMISKKP
jgi:hypothetical protein